MTTIEEFAADAQEDYKAVGCVSYLTVGKYLETILEHFDSLQDYLPPEVMNSAIEQLQNTDRTYSDRVTQWAIERRKEFERYLEEEKHTVERLQGGDKKTPTALDKGKTRPVKELVALVCLDDVEEEEVAWLYYPYIPRGKLTLCAAYPGVGKTYLLCYITACVTTGKSFFNIVPFDNKLGNVIFLTAEDGIADTIKKRLRQCGADMRRVFAPIENKTQLLFDSPEIEGYFRDYKPDLVIFDPFQAYIGSDVDMNAPNKTNERVGHIVDLAERYNVAVVLICHFNKNAKGDAITRVLGSTDIVGKCRSYIALGNVPDEEDIKFMSHEKSSLSKKGKTILFEIDPDKGGIVYLGENSLSVDDYTAIRQRKRQKAAPAVEAAKQFLIDQMPEGKRLAKELQELATANKISGSALQRARGELGIVSKKTKEFPPKSMWVLPGHEDDEEKPVQESLPL